MIYSITLLYDRHQQAGMLKVSENAFFASWSFRSTSQKLWAIQRVAYTQFKKKNKIVRDLFNVYLPNECITSMIEITVQTDQI